MWNQLRHLYLVIKIGSFFYKEQIPSRPKGQTTCLHHKGRQHDIYCKKCQELACTKYLSTLHKNHPLCDISEITPKKKKDIQTFIDQAEKVDLVQIDQCIASTDTQLKDNASHFEKLSHQLKTHTNKLKQTIDLLTVEVLSRVKEMEKENSTLLQTYKQNLEMLGSQLKEHVQECKKALERGSDIQIYGIGSEILSSITLPVMPVLVKANFTPNSNSANNLKKAMGKMDICKVQGKALQSQHTSVVGKMSTSSQQSPASSESIEDSEQELFIRLMLLTVTTSRILSKEADVLEEFTLEHEHLVSSICPTTDGQVWVTYYGSTTLTLLDRTGNETQEVTHNTAIKDIHLSPTTNTLWVCDWDKNITELVSGHLEHRFSTREEPQCICITASNHIVVGMNGHISKFTPEGELVLTTLSAGTGSQLICIPWKIAECPVTHNVAVADWNRDIFSERNIEKKLKVVVVDKDFKKLCVYNGTPEDEEFAPFGVVYASDGNLCIVDCFSNRIQLVSGRGEFITSIYTDNTHITAVGVDGKGDMWAMVLPNKVRILHLPRSSDKLSCVIL